MRKPPIAIDKAKAPPSGQAPDTVPVLRPLLPPARRLLPYLRRIDAARTYTNWGPLVCELETRLARQFGVADGSVVSASSGTAALVGAILATAGRAHPDRPFAMLPAFTFVATASAVEQCGYIPYPVDVDNDSWLMDATRIADPALLGRIGVVVPVAAFGRPVPQEPWAAFRRRTGIPVVIDGAASFEALSQEPGVWIGEVPVALSFHATKSFATGEGGCVVATDVQLAKLVAEALNFGFYGSRFSRSASTNGKLSEYHAAIGLAELDGWAKKRRALMRVADRYRRCLTPIGLAHRFASAPAIASCYALFRCADRSEADLVQRSLRMSDIEFRLWYGTGLLNQPYFSHLLHDTLPVTDALAPCVIGLPVAVDLSDSAIERIVAALHSSVSGVPDHRSRK